MIFRCLIYFQLNPVNLLIDLNPCSDYSVLKPAYRQAGSLSRNKAGFRFAHSVRKDSTGFATAALIVWKLTVTMANKTVANAATAKTFHVIVVR